jgi:hypothetical protein
MKIEIDTKKDTKEDIQKIIKMLQEMVSEGSNYEPYSNTSENTAAGFGFLDTPTTESDSKAEEKEEQPRVQLY